MVRVEVPNRFIAVFKAALASEIADLHDAASQLKRKGRSPSQIVEKIVKAGWDSQFAVWYVDRMFEANDDLELTLPSFFVEIPQKSEEEIKVRARADKSNGWAIALLGSAWIVLWPWLGIEGAVAMWLGILVIGTGFAFLAKGYGLHPNHGLCAISVFLAYYGIYYFWWAGVMGSRDRQLQEELRIPYIVLNTLVPVTFTWIMYALSLRQGLRLKNAKSKSTNTP